MKTFSEFLENDGNQQPIAPGSQLPINQNSGAGSAPPTPSNPSGGTQSSPEQDRTLENLTNDIQRRIEQLFQTLDKHHMDKHKAMGMLSTIISTIANQYGLSSSNVKQAGQNGMAFNSEPSSPPQQPQAV